MYIIRHPLSSPAPPFQKKDPVIIYMVCEHVVKTSPKFPAILYLQHYYILQSYHSGTFELRTYGVHTNCICKQCTYIQAQLQYYNNIIIHVHTSQWRSQVGGKGGIFPRFFSRKCDTCSLYYDQLFVKQITSYFSQRDVVNIVSNDFDKAGYKADILSTYFHDDRLNHR